MVPQFDNLVMSSVLLWADNKLLTMGLAYTNFASRLYKVQDTIQGVYTYGLPFKQTVSDSSISGANIMSGIYVNNVFVTPGVSGLLDIDHAEGRAYFSQNLNSSSLSGNYAVKDFNFYLTAEPDSILLFETKYDARPKTQKQVTGLATNQITYPAIFLKNATSENQPFEFGGTQNTCVSVRAIVLADNQFQLDAVCSIFRDTQHKLISLFSASEMPFNVYGGFRNGPYNYTGLAATKQGNNKMFIRKVSISRYNHQSVITTEIKKMNPDVYPALVDFELETIRTV